MIINKQQVVLEVKNVTKNFGHIKAVDDVTFNIDKGEIVGLLGPNGAGKTTTMRVVVSYNYPTTGIIKVNDLRTDLNKEETQTKIGYLAESNPLYTDMLVFDYLALTLALSKHKVEDQQLHIENVAKQVALSSKLGSKINTLSKGYKQRVGIAAALINNPDLLILDEPQEGLDPTQRIELRKIVKDLAVDKAIVISTHVLEEVKALCTKVIVMNEGKIMLQGPVEELSDHKKIFLRIKGSNVRSSLQKIIKETDELNIRNVQQDMKELTIKSQRPIEEEISRLISENNWIIYEMRQEDSLQEIFENLQFTQNV